MKRSLTDREKAIAEAIDAKGFYEEPRPVTHPTSEPRLDEMRLISDIECAWQKMRGDIDDLHAVEKAIRAHERYLAALPVPSGPSREAVATAAKDLSALADKYVAWVKEQTGDTCETDDEGRHTNCHCKEMSFAGEMADIAERLAMYRPAGESRERHQCPECDGCGWYAERVSDDGPPAQAQCQRCSGCGYVAEIERLDRSHAGETK